MKTKRCLILADLHCGHHCGLTPPIYQPLTHDDAPHVVQKYARQRAALWDWFASALSAAGRCDMLLVNGDAIEGKGEKSGGTELLSSDRKTQVSMAAAAIMHAVKTVRAKRIHMTYGTPRHVGTEEDWEQVLAAELGADKLENEGHYDINGLQVSAKHFIGNSSSPMSSMTAMRGAQVKQALWALREQQPRANLIVRSHIHRCYNIGEPALHFQGWTTPALQGLGSKYGTRQCDGLPVDFGFLVLNVDDAGAGGWGMEAYIAPMTLQKAEVLVL